MNSSYHFENSSGSPSLRPEDKAVIDCNPPYLDSAPSQLNHLVLTATRACLTYQPTDPKLKVVGFVLDFEERDGMGFCLFTSARGAMLDLTAPSSFSFFQPDSELTFKITITIL